MRKHDTSKSSRKPLKPPKASKYSPDSHAMVVIVIPSLPVNEDLLTKTDHVIFGSNRTLVFLLLLSLLLFSLLLLVDSENRESSARSNCKVSNIADSLFPPPQMYIFEESSEVAEQCPALGAIVIPSVEEAEESGTKRTFTHLYVLVSKQCTSTSLSMFPAAPPNMIKNRPHRPAT